MADPAGFEPQPEDKPAAVGAAFSKEATKKARRRKHKRTEVKDGKGECDHNYTQHFGGKFSCAYCWKPLEEIAPDRIPIEQRWLYQAEAEDAAIQVDHAELSFCLGVTIPWLIAFTNHYDCWDWDTRDVQAFIIKPETEKTRGRFVDLPHVRAHANVGEADVFISRESVLCF